MADPGAHLLDKMRLYGNPACLNTAKCLFTAAEKGVDIESHFVEINGKAKSAKIPRAAFALMPVLQDVDYVLCGTSAIMSYLDDKGFGPSLVHRNGVVRSVMYMYMQAASEFAQPAVTRLMGGKGNAGEVSEYFDVLESHLGTKTNPAMRGDYICGQFTLADVAWAAVANGCFLAKSGNIVESKSAVANWWGAVKSHPSTSKEKIKAYDILPTAKDISSNTLRGLTINA